MIETINQMSKRDFSVALCEQLGYFVGTISPYKINHYPSIVVRENGRHFSFVLDQWDCIMPLAIENGVSLIKSGGSYMAYCSEVEFIHKCPQRAIASCLLVMLGYEHKDEDEEKTNERD